MLRVTDVEPLNGYRLRVSFSDGLVREIDCAFLLHDALGEPLRNRDYFRQVRVDQDARTIVWPNGRRGEDAVRQHGRMDDQAKPRSTAARLRSG
jgi:hypothetical protein